MFSVSQWAIKRVTPKVLFVHWIRAAAASCAHPLPCADFFRHQPSSADGVDCAESVEAAMVGRPLSVDAAGSFDCAGALEAAAIFWRALSVEAAAATESPAEMVTADPVRTEIAKEVDRNAASKES